MPAGFHLIPLCLSLELLAAGISSAQPATASKPPVISKDPQSVNTGVLSYTVSCDFQKGSNKLEVLLPDDYSSLKHYPVVYMLPVNTGTTGQWGSSIIEAKKANLQNQYQFIFVGPAYDTMPWFGDNPLRSEIRQDSYMLNVVIPFIDKEFSTMAGAGGRMLIGFSKSGLGAWQLFLMHLDIFGQVAIFDSFQGQPSQDQWLHWGFADTYGTRENFDKYDPLSLLDQKKGILQNCPRRITLLAGGPGSRVGVDLYHTKLEDFNIPYIYIRGSYMQHNWYSGWLPLAVAGMAYHDYASQSN